MRLFSDATWRMGSRHVRRASPLPVQSATALARTAAASSLSVRMQWPTDGATLTASRAAFTLAENRVGWCFG